MKKLFLIIEYRLLGYNIYITNVPKQVWSELNITQAYKTRWYIEILFKSWKSNLKIKETIPQRYINKQRAEFYLYSALLMVNLLIMPIFKRTQLKLKNKLAISIIKISTFINQNIQMIINEKMNILEQIKYYSLYKSRKKRINAIETIYFKISQVDASARRRKSIISPFLINMYLPTQKSTTLINFCKAA